MMKETGDTETELHHECKRESELVSKLRTLHHTEDKEPSLQVSRWKASDSDELLALIYSAAATSLLNNVKSKLNVPNKCGEKGGQENLNDLLESKQINKRSKIHLHRLEVLSLPRRVRAKVQVPPVNRVLLPFNETSTFSSMSIDDGGIAKIALQYRKDGDKTLKYHHGNPFFPCFQGEHTKFANQRRSIERSLHEFIQTKSESQSSPDRLSKFFQSQLTPPNESPQFSECFDDETKSSETCVDVLSEPELPYPPSNLYKPFRYKKDRFDVFLPPLKPKKSHLGKITAISEENKRNGRKTNSIKKLGRHPIARPSRILPRLAGSKLEIPLLPKSPDFLYRAV